MFISVLDLFKTGIGPSSSHTMGPMIAAHAFLQLAGQFLNAHPAQQDVRITCRLKGSLAFTGKGHGTDKAIVLGLNGYRPNELAAENINELVNTLKKQDCLVCKLANSKPQAKKTKRIYFNPQEDIHFDLGPPLPEHPNGMVFQLIDISQQGSSPHVLTSETYFSIGGGFINTQKEITQLVAPLKMIPNVEYPYGFTSADEMLNMADDSGLNIAQMKTQNELQNTSQDTLNKDLDHIWATMKTCIENGLNVKGILPGGLNIKRRAQDLHRQLNQHPQNANLNDWLCAYAMAVNEENADGHVVVTAPTNGAAGVIPAVLYYWATQHQANDQQVRTFLLTAAAIGGIIKHKSSISGAEVGCQGEVGSAAAMAAAGLCAVSHGTPKQIENAAEIALEHHLGMTCDPVKGLVQVPCIERNGFGAIKAYTAASLALRGSGEHFMSLDNCIAAMKQTGLEMSHKYKETALGGLAVCITEC
jgi:L-serine dehydratase